MTHWPTWLDEAGIMAKSREKGGETLAGHTWQVLCRLGDQARLRPDLVELVGQRLWPRMYWACLLHDFGKAAAGFQAILRPPTSELNLWAEARHRHEVLSLGFVDWLFPNGHPDREWVIGAIACHHKDATDIFLRYGGDLPLRDLPDQSRDTTVEILTFLADQIGADTRQHLWRWVDECGQAWAAELGIVLPKMPSLLPCDEAVGADLGMSVFRALRDFAEWQKQLVGRDRLAAIITRGLILTADHAASAGADEFPPMPLSREVAEWPMAGWNLKSHQVQAASAGHGSTIMIAPTGSGKTEAAMLWAARQIEHRPAPRLFYTLPYQASMNAMADRIAQRYFELELSDSERNHAVTVQHSRALLKFYQDMMAADESNPKATIRSAKWIKNLAALSYFPIQVFSPYQMLKAAYSLRGYEALLVDYTGGLFVFDEIHAYEPGRMALIVTMIRWLAENFHSRFLIMTATLPPTVQKAFADALPTHTEITADAKDFEASQRHIVRILDGCLLEQLDRIADDVAAGQAVLVCLNRVTHAQQAFIRLREMLKDRIGLADDQFVLLHGRFNGEDRSRRERELLQAVGVKSEGRRRPYVVVATQVVEVSLDIDLDTIYTDPAPLEALLQRFGRVNRGRAEQVLLPVHVFREPFSEGEKDPYLPYEQDIVLEGMRVLEAHYQGKPIDEAQVTKMLDEIYRQPSIWDNWWAAYYKHAKDFQQAILDQMKPYKSAELHVMQSFYQLFDGVEVLPVDCEEQYHNALENEGYLKASQYLVSISWGNFRRLQGKKRVLGRDQGDYADQVDVPYDPDFGLDLDAAFEVSED